ncbi:hypothetical protein AB0I84_08870 [Streptomyces spectabilis]|uniref:hypothetical protein n=1 Tax=Streptomyces spectabilis TaxID=68270 RepID=UPI0033EFA1BD
MILTEGTVVTPAHSIPRGEFRPFGRVVGHATAPLTGERLTLVRWDGLMKPLAYADHELAIAD